MTGALPQHLQRSSDVRGIECDVVDHDIELSIAQRAAQSSRVTAICLQELDAMQPARCMLPARQHSYVVSVAGKLLCNATTQEASAANHQHLPGDSGAHEQV